MDKCLCIGKMPQMRASIELECKSWQSAENGLERDRNAHKCKITEAQEQDIKAKMKAKRESDGFYNFTEELNYYNALRAQAEREL